MNILEKLHHCPNCKCDRPVTITEKLRDEIPQFKCKDCGHEWAEPLSLIDRAILDYVREY